MNEEQYQQAETFWQRKQKDEKVMEKEKLEKWMEEFLTHHKVLALATGMKEDLRVTPLEYSYHDGALYIFTEGGLKFHGIHENKHVAAAIFEDNPVFGKLQSMQISGIIEMVELFSKEYNGVALARKIPLDALHQLKEPMWLLKIIPEEITCLNSLFKKEGYGSYQQWKK
ncbi:MAG: pyridoxamine 5'-phosphate oxidase family protein [Intestinibaculum porci]|uniref:pyridoxamine 5'-phosphate oxidase family protein n=1 Tax=Intestinibaculum porci TaxID=2487118 RepID=UPI002408F73B|nr:pyridoxamine 5'-phosphate oxidase family protein [Intestinibaculum porci]MDD6423315.1 pyridoxamine 5'-phosphate oxidase family protein [Intestinibaculum porci]